MAQILPSSFQHIPTRSELITLARRFNTKKHLGQNFLINPAIHERIAASLDLDARDHVLEIGSGLGFLTNFLSRTGAQVTAVEFDSAAVEQLSDIKLPNLNIVHSDFLRYDISTLTAKLGSGQKLKVAGNVPYQITSKIIAYLFGEIDKPSAWVASIGSVILMVQLEVAQRLIAKPGEDDYSQISILADFFTVPKLLEVVPADNFYPEPKVDSALVLLTPRLETPISCNNLRLMRQIIQAGFRQRRKMLRNNLSFLNLDPSQLLSVFQSINLDPQTRAERLSLAQFALLTNTVNTLTKADTAEAVLSKDN